MGHTDAVAIHAPWTTTSDIGAIGSLCATLDDLWCTNVKHSQMRAMAGACAERFGDSAAGRAQSLTEYAQHSFCLDHVHHALVHWISWAFSPAVLRVQAPHNTPQHFARGCTAGIIHIHRCLSSPQSVVCVESVLMQRQPESSKRVLSGLWFFLSLAAKSMALRSVASSNAAGNGDDDGRGDEAEVDEPSIIDELESGHESEIGPIVTRRFRQALFGLMRVVATEVNQLCSANLVELVDTQVCGSGVT